MASCKVTVSSGRYDYRCELPEGHDGQHLGHYTNGKPIRWPLNQLNGGA